MGEVQIMRMTPDEFLAWDLDQPDARHELVEGVPRAMTGANRRHDRIVINLLAELRRTLRGKTCTPSTADSAVRIPNGNIRRPDAAVDCGRYTPDNLTLDAPTVIFEVLSRSTRLIDHHRKMEDYKLLPTLRSYLLVYQEIARVTVVRREDGGGWALDDVIGLESAIDLPEIGLTLLLSEIYDGIDLEA